MTAHADASASEAPGDRYWRVLVGVAPRLLSLLDREQRSPTRGSFDRVNWAWKFRDFPLTMWQASMMPLATLWRVPHPTNPYAQHPRLADWLGAAVAHTIGRQHRNGAFDSFTPFSQDHGVTLAMVMTLCTTSDLLGDALDDAVRARLVEAVTRACRFAAASDEDYAFINNHQSAFALAYLRAARLTGDATLVSRADAVIDRILAHQSRDGWFEEYGGPDPGYETFGLTYLALAHREQARPDLAKALARSVTFLSHCVHPDGSLGGNYGSRNTGQYAPGGLELLAPSVPMARAIADFMGSRMDGGNVVTPLRSDDDNLPLLTFSYAVAAMSAVDRVGDAAALPCERRDVMARFNDSGFVVASTPHYFAITNLSKGGAVRVFDRSNAALTYEDAGYVIESEGRDWSAQMLGESVPAPQGEAETHEVSAHFSAVNRELLTPVKFLVLRILNLTVFRSVWLGALVRRLIIARLITRRERGPWALHRVLTFAPDRVVIRDQVTPSGEGRVTFASLERSLLPVHMGSAKYFTTNELSAVQPPQLDGWVEALTRGVPAVLSQVIAFADGTVTSRHEVGAAPRTAPRERPTA
jgi:hypothetical protein